VAAIDQLRDVAPILGMSALDFGERLRMEIEVVKVEAAFARDARPSRSASRPMRA